MVQKVTFDSRLTIYIQYVWQFAYQQARKSEWQQYARDHDRFARRILESELVVNTIINSQHCERVFVSLYPHK